ncbi:MAG: ABC transporter permease [Christensenellales bacterium]|jgi:putative aldouronate transport system permease protein
MLDVKVRGAAKSDFLRRIQKTWILTAMIVPGFIYYIIFEYVPMYGILIAFQNYRLGNSFLAGPWVGFRHFIAFFEHQHFARLVRNTLIINLYQVLFSFPMPILLALLLNEVRNRLIKNFVQTVSYLPHFISMVAVAGMLTVLLSPDNGIVNRMLVAFGAKPIYFLAETRWYRSVYIISDIWKTVGYGSIVYLASLSNVPLELYEAATVDGASRIQKITKISLPSIMPTITIMLILKMGGIMSLGVDKSLLLQTPITYEVSDVISTFVYRRGLEKAEYSFASAVGLFNSGINALMLVGTNALSKQMSEVALW